MRPEDTGAAVLRYAARPGGRRKRWWIPPVWVWGLALVVGAGAALVAPNFIGVTACGPATFSQTMVSTGAVAVDLYRLEVGQYPATLADLTTRPADPDLAVKWNGPYINDRNDLRDRWGNWLQYRVPGRKNPATYDLWSVGPDGMNGTADDIGNW